MIASSRLRTATLAALGAGMLCMSATPGLAKKARHGGYDTVTAVSNYDRWKTVTAPVRPGPRGGWQVRLPGGAWIDCFGGCTEALRVQYLDYWETIHENSPSR